MNEIRMVDLLGQYRKIKPEIDQSIQQVIESTAFIKGPEVKSFQKDLENYLGIKHVITCGNGTDALQISLMALGLKPGDEIITTDFTFIATVEVIELLGLKTVIVDPEPDSFNISPAAIERAITKNTKAIIPVHLFGQCADMESIMTLAGKYNLYVIEDAAQALGAEYSFSNGTGKKAGTIGDIGCTSFFPSKNLGCYGDGGAIFTNNQNLAEKLQSIANHGMKIKYYHEQVGINSRLDSLQAAILRVKLKHLDQFNQTRQKTAGIYDRLLKNINNITIPSRTSDSTHIFNQYTIKLKDIHRTELREFLQSAGIPTMIYYPVPMHLQNAYRHLGYKEGDFPVTEDLCRTVLSLPMHTELTEEQINYIAGSTHKFVNKS
ncbi:MAG: DegT/DnrJ/EryC1/StrS family aminotransferase [Bacteroidales bacterium]|nr:DegT/DnrJ/EryC1/StrS family aminotransferase [Bacteroidales bacterium]